MRKAEELLEKYNSGVATPEEKAIVESWYLKYEASPSNLEPHDLLEEEKMGLERLYQSIQKRKIRQSRIRMSIAASLLMFVGISWFFINSKERSTEQDPFMSVLLPETNSAILTLGDGRKITISEGNIGEIMEHEGIRITQTADGHLVYNIIGDGKKSTVPTYNTIETPIGNQYTVVLPDGSRVLLSSGSKLRYPVHFEEKGRKVELVGQAHFEVVHVVAPLRGIGQSGQNKIPFVVMAGNQEVEVLGTEFNLSAYQDDDVIETALLEGSVKVSIKGSVDGVLLRPGQIAVNDLSGSKPMVEEIDVGDLKAWKEGYFIFNNENIKGIMKKLSRWYGFEVEYQGDMSDIAFQGNYLRTRDVNNLLKTMEMANSVQFDIVDKHNERRVIVKRKN